MEPNYRELFETLHVHVEQERDLFFTHSYDMLAIVDSTGYFRRTNPSFERVLGYTRTDLESKRVTEFMHPEDVGKTNQRLKTLAAGTPTISSRNRYRCKDGTYKWISWNSIPIGSFIYTIGRDVSREVELEESNEAQIRQLQKMDAVGRLAGGIAHDFNNILGSISLYCDLVHEDIQNPEFVSDQIEEIRTVTARATSLTQQLLVFSRKKAAQSQSLSLNPLIRQIENMLTRLVGENIKISMTLPEELHNVHADPSQVEQIILNLVVNARDAMPSGGNISIETSNVYLDNPSQGALLPVTKGDYVQLSVSDTGTGMSVETLEKIFEPFFTTKPVGKGTGLGLSTTYGIVKQSEGTIRIQSELGKGTTFKIYLPVAKASS